MFIMKSWRGLKGFESPPEMYRPSIDNYRSAWSDVEEELKYLDENWDQLLIDLKETIRAEAEVTDIATLVAESGIEEGYGSGIPLTFGFTEDQVWFSWTSPIEVGKMFPGKSDLNVFRRDFETRIKQRFTSNSLSPQTSMLGQGELFENITKPRSPFVFLTPNVIIIRNYQQASDQTTLPGSRDTVFLTAKTKPVALKLTAQYFARGVHTLILEREVNDLLALVKEITENYDDVLEMAKISLQTANKVVFDRLNDSPLDLNALREMISRAKDKKLS